MSKEGNSGRDTPDVFLEKLKLEQLEFGSENYWVVRKALEIGQLYYERYESNSGFLSGLEEQDIERQKEEVIRNNGNNPMFMDKFKNICKWMMTDLGTIPAVRISRKLGYLKDKIRETDERVDLV